MFGGERKPKGPVTPETAQILSRLDDLRNQVRIELKSKESFAAFAGRVAEKCKDRMGSVAVGAMGTFTVPKGQTAEEFLDRVRDVMVIQKQCPPDMADAFLGRRPMNIGDEPRNE